MGHRTFGYGHKRKKQFQSTSSTTYLNFCSGCMLLIGLTTALVYTYD